MLSKIMPFPARLQKFGADVSFSDRARLKRNLIKLALHFRRCSSKATAANPLRDSMCRLERVARSQWTWARKVAQMPSDSLVQLAVLCFPHTVHPLGRATCSLHYFSLGYEHDNPENWQPQCRSAVYWHDRVGAIAVSGVNRKGVRTIAWLAKAKLDSSVWFEQRQDFVLSECKNSGLYVLLFPCLC